MEQQREGSSEGGNSRRKGSQQVQAEEHANDQVADNQRPKNELDSFHAITQWTALDQLPPHSQSMGLGNEARNDNSQWNKGGNQLVGF